MKIDIYKVYDPITKLYSKGGISKEFSKHGKIWVSSQALRNHLGQFVQRKWVRSEGTYGNFQIIIPESWVVEHLYTDEEGNVCEERINAIEFYLQSKNTNYAKWKKSKS